MDRSCIHFSHSREPSNARYRLDSLNYPKIQTCGVVHPGNPPAHLCVECQVLEDEEEVILEEVILEEEEVGAVVEEDEVEVEVEDEVEVEEDEVEDREVIPKEEGVAAE